MCGADKNAALASRGANRRTFGPGRQTRSASATTGQSPITTIADRAKVTDEIDIVLFLPAHSAFCRRAELVLLCCVPFAALSAVLALAAQVALR